MSAATTIAHSHVLVNRKTNAPSYNLAGHETFHFCKSKADREAYIEILADNINFNSSEFQILQSKITEAYFESKVDLGSQKQSEKFFEEIFAYISGFIHGSEHDDVLSKMLCDVDAVRAAWNGLVDANRGGVEETAAVDKTVADVGVAIDSKTGTAHPARYSLKTWNKSEYVQKKKEAAEALRKSLGVSFCKAAKYINDINGKVERSHREDRKRFYSCYTFYSLNDFATQLTVHNRRSNNLPMRPLRWLSPNEFAVQYV